MRRVSSGNYFVTNRGAFLPPLSDPSLSLPILAFGILKRLVVKIMVPFWVP